MFGGHTFLLRAGMALGSVVGLVVAVYLTQQVLDRIGTAADTVAAEKAEKERQLARQAVTQGCGCCCCADGDQSTKSCCST